MKNLLQGGLWLCGSLDLAEGCGHPDASALMAAERWDAGPSWTSSGGVDGRGRATISASGA